MERKNLLSEKTIIKFLSFAFLSYFIIIVFFKIIMKEREEEFKGKLKRKRLMR